METSQNGTVNIYKGYYDANVRTRYQRNTVCYKNLNFTYTRPSSGFIDSDNWIDSFFDWLNDNISTEV